MVQEGLEAKLIHLTADGSTQVLTSDASTQLLLDPHRLRATVCYPVLIAADPSRQAFTYMSHQQQFAVKALPPRWYPALRVALAAAHHACAAHAAGLGTAGHLSTQQDPDQCKQRAWADARPLPLPQHASGQQQPYAPQADAIMSQDVWQAEHGPDLSCACLPAPAPGQHEMLMYAPREQICGVLPGADHTMAPFSSELAGTAGYQWPVGVSVASSSTPQHPCEQYLQLQEAWSSNITRLPVPGGLRGDPAGDLAFTELHWWRSPSSATSPGGPPVQVEQTPEATYHCLPDQGEVHAWVRHQPRHFSPSLLTCVA